MKAIAVNTYGVDVGSFRPVVVEILTDEGISASAKARSASASAATLRPP